MDGFVVNPYNAMGQSECGSDLKGSKDLQKKRASEQYAQVFKGDEGMVREVIRQLWAAGPQKTAAVPLSHTGFTLCDLVSYDGKHNEANGERNQDGPDYNYS